MLCEAAAGQGAVRRHGDVVFRAEFGHFPLFFAENQIVMALDRDELREPFPLCERVCFGELVGKAVGDADIAHLARLDGLV